MVLDVLRIAPAPMTVRDITVEVMQRRGLDTTDACTVKQVTMLVHNSFTRQAANLVERVEDGKVTAWRSHGALGP